MIRTICIFLVAQLSTGLLSAQSFSEDPDQFVLEAKAVLESVGSEAYDKVAYDFQNAWTSKFTSDHRETVMEIAALMRKKGYPLNPHFKHFFAYLGYAVENEGIQADQLTQVLDINLGSFHSLTRDEYADFLFEMSTFFGRRWLHLSKTVVTQANGGSYDFELVGGLAPGEIPVFDDQAEEEPVEEDDGFLTDEDIQNMNQQVIQADDATADSDSWSTTDDWGTTDSWSTTDDWSSSTDDWGTTTDDWGSTTDDWGTTTDDWGTTTDDWGATDTWGSQDDSSFGTPAEVYEPPAPVRQEFSQIVTDYVGQVKAKYIHPPTEGPTIHLSRTEIVIATPFDSIIFKNTDGDHLLKSRTFAGKSASLDWPAENERTRGASVRLGEFSLRVDRGSFWTPNATLTFPALFDSTTEGSFQFKSIRRPKRALSNYPIFTSYNNDVRLNLADGKATYQGGIQLKGNKLFGTSISKEKGVLTVLDGKGNSAVFKAANYVFEDSVISTENAALTIKHGSDSIYHPSVSMKYLVSKNEMIINRTKKYDVTPFHSTFFQMAFGADQMKWYLDADSIDLNIVQGKDLLPATFESDDYFNRIRFARLSGMFGFHPVSISVHYAKKYGINAFNILELVAEYEVNEKLVIGAMKMLEQYNFCDFDEATGHVALYDKAFHYYESSAKRKDYDNLFISSKISRVPNATIRLDSGEIMVRGVEKFFVTSDFSISIEPLNEEVVLEQGRNLRFGGALDAGDFNYKGKDFDFDYNEFLVRMPIIDSIRLTIPIPDSIQTGTSDRRQALENHLTQTSGTIYLDMPDNKSGLDVNTNYPYFVSESEAIVYFDGPEVLDGAYDKSVMFIIPPMEIDSLDREDGASIYFPGRFNSGGIFPIFEDTLHIMADQSLGFVHHIPEEGYNLYGTPARTYEKITLSNSGMVGGGKIDFLNSTIFSEDFIYYPDSVTADGYFGTIAPGTVGGGSFPQAEMGKFRMYWLPRKDSMYLKTVEDPFKFYHGTAELTGEANITQKGVYGSGSMLTRGSVAESNELSFREFSYAARHAKFEVLSDDPDKPAMAGDDIRLNFDLTLNKADVNPEIAGVAAISFPYAQMKTSITKAEWFLEDSIITMTKPEEVPIEESYFYSTLEELDSLAFNATKAIYDIQTYKLNVQGIPFIPVADAKVVPENNETTILENSILQTFKNAGLVFESPEVKHVLYDAVVDVKSRNEFTATATYQLPVQADTFEIKMSDFHTEKFPLADGTFDSASVATGNVDEAMNLDIAAGFLYKGEVKLVANKQALELSGYVKPNFKTLPDQENWIAFERTDDRTEVVIDFNNATYENGEKALAGLHQDSYTGKLYPTMIEERITPGDDDFFMAKGDFRYNPKTDNYIIEDPGKSSGELYEGHTLIYNDSSQALFFEGKVNFIDPIANNIEINAAVLGEGNRETNEFNLDAFLTIDLKVQKQFLSAMASDIIDIIERLGNPVANDLSIESMLKLANIIGEEATREYETESLKDYVPLVETSDLLNKSIVISGVKMKWNDKENAWHNTTKLALSNINLEDVNAKVDGFLEIKKDDTGGDLVNLFIEAAPGSWYYFNFQENSLLIYTSNRALNQDIADKSNFGKAKPGEMVLIAGDENETLSFLNSFLKVYLGINEPYNLVYPDDVSLDDESFDTIDEDEDDGFGF